MINNFNFSVGDIGYPPKKKTLIPSTKLSDLFSDTITTVIPTDEYNHSSLYNNQIVQRSTITGRKYNVPYGATAGEVNKIIFGDEYLYHALLELGNSFVQGTTIELTGGTATVAKHLLVQGGAVVVRALSQAVVANQVNNKSVSTSLIYGGLSQLKFGNIAAFKDAAKLANVRGITALVVETSDKWHHTVDDYSIQIFRKFIPKDYVKVPSIGSEFKFDAIYTSFGLAQAEKQYATGKNVYKALSSHKKSNDGFIGNGDALQNSEKNKNYKNQNTTQKNIEKVASAQDKFIKNLKVDDPNRNELGETIDAFRAFSTMLDENILENKQYVMEYNNYQKDLLTNGPFTNKIKAATNLPFQIGLNAIEPIVNISNAVGSTLINGADLLLQGFGKIINILYVTEQTYSKVGGDSIDVGYKIVSVENKDGKTTITKKRINPPNSEQSDIQKKMNELTKTKPKTQAEKNIEAFEKIKEATIANDYLKSFGRPSVASILAIPNLNTPNKTNAFFKGK
jgi:hypothetical protein